MSGNTDFLSLNLKNNMLGIWKHFPPTLYIIILKWIIVAAQM